MAEAGDRFGLVGTLVADKYYIERVVGEGGFGIVYRAVHKIWDEPVAVKCFTALSNAPVELREELLEQFVREGKLLTALSSRTTGIVQARDIGTLTTPGGVWLPYMVLEWLDGRPLETWIANDNGVPRAPQRGVLETFNLMDGPARALALAHVRGVAHRDLKPANFFVLGSELVPGVVIKVLDFGIAKVMQSQARTAMQATGTQISSFTPSYGAPEQFDRTYGATGPWTDVYQMALVLVEIMRGGAPALEGEQFIQLAFATQNHERRPTPRLHGIETSDAVEAVFQRALAIKVVDRYPNMAEFWTALAAALELKEYPPITAGETGFGQVVATEGAAPGGKTRRSSDLLAQTPVVTMSAPPVMTMSAPPTPVAATVVSPPAPTARPSSAGKIAALVGVIAIGGVATALALKGPSEPPPPDTPKVVEAPRPEVKAVPPPTTPPPPPPCPENMAYVTGKNFFMGTDSERPVLALARPPHKVQIRPFCIDLYEVTTEEYEKCSDAGDCKRAYKDSFWPQGSSKKADWDKARKAHSPLCNAGNPERARHPINCVTWAQADEFCRVHGKRLPTETEFEFAARGSDGRVFPWGDGAPSPEHLNACGTECVKWREDNGLPPVEPMYDADDGHVGTAPVGSFPGGKTQNGLFDLIGNVFEWTADRFERYPAAEGVAPAAPPPGNNRVIRGGAFNSYEPEHTDPALRFPNDAEAHTHGIGFRCAADPR